MTVGPRVSEPNGLPVFGLVLARCVARGGEDVAPAAQPARDVEDRHDDHHVDEDVLDEGDQGGRPQPGQPGVGGEQHEGDDQRQVLDERVARVAAHPQHGQYRLDADQLQGDVGHGGQDAGHRDRQRQATRSVAAADEVRRRDVVVDPGHRPQPGGEHEHDREDDDRVRDGEEPDRPHPEHQGGHGDEGVGGVEITAEQEPGDERAEATSAQSPLVEVQLVLGPAPAGGGEANQRDDREHDNDDGEGDRVPAHVSSPPQGLVPGTAGRPLRCPALSAG